MTVNISVMAIVIIGCASTGEPPFSIVQLLWVNLIMDTLAALALATEPPLPKILKDKPTKMQDNIFTPVMWRQIFGVSLYQITVITLIMHFGRAMWGLDYTAADEFQGTEKSEAKLTHYTLMFNTFIFMQIFNSLNCRKIGVQEANICEAMFNNMMYLIIVVIEIGVQVMMVNMFGPLVRAQPLNGDQHAACILLALGVLLVAGLLKCTNPEWVEKFDIPMDENTKSDDQMLNKFKTLKDTKKKISSLQANPAISNKSGEAENLA